jgi:hypothetical protein
VLNIILKRVIQSRVSSIIDRESGHNIYNCTFFGLCFQVPEIESNIGVLTSLKLVTDVARFLTVSADKIQLLFELIMVRDGMLNLCNPYASSLAPFF